MSSQKIWFPWRYENMKSSIIEINGHLSRIKTFSKISELPKSINLNTNELLKSICIYLEYVLKTINENKVELARLQKSVLCLCCEHFIEDAEFFILHLQYEIDRKSPEFYAYLHHYD